MPLNRIRPNNGTNDSLVAITNINASQLKKMADCVNTTSNLLRVDIEDAQINVDGTGLATEQTLKDLDTRIGNSIFSSSTALGTGQAVIQTTTRAINSGSSTMKPLVMDANDNLNVNINAGGGSHGLATEAKQDVMETSLNSIDTRIGNSVNAGSTVYGDAASGVISTYAYGRDSGNNQMKALSLDSSGNLNVNMASGAITGFATEATQLLAEAHLGTIDSSTASVAGCVSGSELQVDIVGAPTLTVSGTITANAGTNLNTSTLATQSTLADAEAHLGTIDSSTASLAGCVDGSKIQVDIDTAPTLTVSGTITANAGTNLNTSALATQTTLAAAEAHLGTIDTSTASLATCVDGSKIQVDIDTAPTLTVSGTITANAGTNLNTSALATESTLAAAEAHLGTIDTSTASLAGCVSGSELQVDIVSGGGGDASASNQSSMITKLGEIDTAQDLTNTKLDTIDGVLDNILVDTSLVKNQQLLQASHLALHQTGTTNTTITIGNGANSTTKEVSLSDIRAAIVEPSAIGFHLTSTGTGGSGTDIEMEVSLDGSSFINLATNLGGFAKAATTGNLGDDAIGLPLVGQKFRFKIHNNSGGSANYTVSIFAYGMDFAQA